MSRRFQVIITLALGAIVGLPTVLACTNPDPNAPISADELHRQEVRLSVYGGESGQSQAIITYQNKNGKFVQVDPADLPWSIEMIRGDRTSVTAEVLGGNAEKLECVAERGDGQDDKDDTKFVIGNKVTCSI